MSAVAEARPIGRVLPGPRTWPWTTLLRAGSLGAIVVGLAATAALGSPQAIIVAAIGLALVLGIVRTFFREADRHFLLTLALAAFGARIVLAVVSHQALVYVGREGFLLMDDRAYGKLGWTLARVWMGIFPGIRDTDEYLMVNYTYMVAGVYYALGHNLLAAKMMNVTFGTITPMVVYALGRELFGGRAARLAAVLAAFFPSLLIWSVLNLKDPLTILLTASVVLGATLYARRHAWPALLLCLGALLAIENLRLHAFLMLLWLTPIGYLVADRSRLPRKLLLFVPLLVGILALNIFTNNKGGLNWLTPKALTEAEWARHVGAREADTGIPGNEVKPPKDASNIVERSIQYLPTGIFYALFGPLPWEARSSSARAVIPEMLAWYGLLGATLIGLLRSFRTSWRDLVLPMAFVGAWLVALAWIGGNTGNFFRQRGMTMPFVFPVAAVGLLWLWDRWRARRPAPTAAVVGRAQPTEGTV